MVGIGILHPCMQDEYKMEPGTVIAADFYHSNTLMPLPDAEIVAKVKSNLDHCEPIFRSAQVDLTHTCTSLHTSASLLRLSVWWLVWFKKPG